MSCRHQIWKMINDRGFNFFSNSCYHLQSQYYTQTISNKISLHYDSHNISSTIANLKKTFTPHNLRAITQAQHLEITLNNNKRRSQKTLNNKKDTRANKKAWSCNIKGKIMGLSAAHLNRTYFKSFSVLSNIYFGSDSTITQPYGPGWMLWKTLRVLLVSRWGLGNYFSSVTLYKNYGKTVARKICLKGRVIHLVNNITLNYVVLFLVYLVKFYKTCRT